MMDRGYQGDSYRLRQEAQASGKLFVKFSGANCLLFFLCEDVPRWLGFSMSYLSASNSKQYPDSFRRDQFAAYRASKRIIDVIFSLSALLFLLPVIILILAALAIQDGLPIVYRQRRIGLQGQEFFCLKFRTMSKNAESRLAEILAGSPEIRKEWDENQKLRQDPRVHWVGHILRRSSLDEIPQFINVLRGEMSVVGPRPIVRDEISRYNESFRYYISMKPGITGFWQVSGRNATTYDQRVEYDTDYYFKRSVATDLRIMLRTVSAVLLARGSG